MPTNTLTSLAILKVNVNHGRDYLDYLRPFILQVLVENKPDPITGNVVSSHIQRQFGLEIPERAVNIVLGRISKQHFIKRESGVYRQTGELPDPRIVSKWAEAERHIGAVLHGLQQFSKETINPIPNDEVAVNATCAFLGEFGITCLRSYLRGTAIPDLEHTHHADIVLVSQYVQHIQRTDPISFNSFLVLVQGHMLANALMCPDLHNAPQTYKGMSFYFDTPLLVQALGLEGDSRKVAARELIALLTKLGGKVVAFSHSRNELQGVIYGAANHLESWSGRGSIVLEARKAGVSRADLIYLADSLEDELSKIGIEVQPTPRYTEQHQIDEAVFEQVLEDEVSYYNARARDDDINSVRSIYVIRANAAVSSLEKAKAVLVTSNAAFAKAAWNYGKQYRASENVSSVITDFSLANVAWLKAPMGAPDVPVTQLLAFSYAALKPSSDLLGKYLKEIELLESKGEIDPSQHQLLRGSHLAYQELMHLTLGQDTALTGETVSEIIDRVSGEIKKGESERLNEEQKAHQETKDALETEQSRHQEIVSNLYWRCHKQAKIRSLLLSGALAGLVVAGLLASIIRLSLTDPILSLLGGVVLGVSVVLTSLNLIFGTTLKSVHGWLQKKLLRWSLKRESTAIGIDLSAWVGED